MAHRGLWRPWSGRSGSATSRAARLLLSGVGLLLVGVVGGADAAPAAEPAPVPTGEWRADRFGARPGTPATGCAPACPPTATAPTGTGPASGAEPVAGTEKLPGPASTASSDGAPTRVRIPRIEVNSSLAVLGLDRSGKLSAPADYGQAGWFGAGTAPGDTGPAVIAGHVDSTTGPAVFYRLHELRPGDRIEVRRGARWLPFLVVSTSRHDKDEFPTDEVYGPTPGPELRLVTCAGSFDPRAGSYRDNLVVFAVAG